MRARRGCENFMDWRKRDGGLPNTPVGSIKPASLPTARRVAAWFPALLLLLASCRGPSAMMGTFIDYSQAYAETSNQQILLNLARRANGHPVYFLQMGSVSSTFQFGLSAGANAGQSRSRNSGLGAGLSDTVTLGGTLGANVSEQPTFSFIPLSGSAFANALFTPVGSTVFFDLFDQGVPVDMLLRVMVQSVTFHNPAGGRTFLNVADTEYPRNYRDFLVIADLARQLQKKHLLWAAPDQSSFAMSSAAGEAAAALSSNRVYRLDSDKLPRDEMETTNRRPGMTLRFRTFAGILSALASESRVFDAIVAGQGAAFAETVPPRQLRPVLQIKAERLRGKTTPPVVQLVYRGAKYEIADAEIKDAATGRIEFDTWNREVFNIVNQIYVQITLDPGKLPVQQLIQVR